MKNAFNVSILTLFYWIIISSDIYWIFISIKNEIHFIILNTHFLRFSNTTLIIILSSQVSLLHVTFFYTGLYNLATSFRKYFRGLYGCVHSYSILCIWDALSALIFNISPSIMYCQDACRIKSYHNVAGRGLRGWCCLANRNKNDLKWILITLRDEAKPNGICHYQGTELSSHWMGGGVLGRTYFKLLKSICIF